MTNNPSTTEMEKARTKAGEFVEEAAKEIDDKAPIDIMSLDEAAIVHAALTSQRERDSILALLPLESPANLAVLVAYSVLKHKKNKS